ncbi:U6 small nuclear RNA (adenine-(43)-N(6))-methyltransferase [Euwallacea similis]|uniref:U6 small nuclear RNA (adenine-(43)-N(6))-methyltransferase n=1 Tax=Euwallacea similis TaxID=1736056 RepID=UPI00344FA393
MSMNRHMHPRNIYKSPPNFKELALEFPEFKPYVKLDFSGKVNFNFKDADALRVLCCTLLKKNFGLTVNLPKNKLVPTIPLRLNYILWIEDLLDFLQKSDKVKGIDIGTGASCVYPLLAAKKNGWSMVATETDPTSFEYAQNNVNNNNLQNLVTVVKVPGDSLLNDAINGQDFDFCMCNPPFFASTQELHPFFKARSASRPHPKNAFVATTTEVVVKGGEVEFIQKMINESKSLKTKVKLYTSMVGQKSHLPALKKSLRQAGVGSFKETEFCQGNTTRWGLAWTFLECNLQKAPDMVKLATKPLKSHVPLFFEVPDLENQPEHVAKVTDAFLLMFKNLEMTFEAVGRNKLHPRYFVSAYSNTWSNQRKKRRENMRKTPEVGMENNNVVEEEKTSPRKRNLEELLCESTAKKLRLSTESETSESSVFYKFMVAVNCSSNNIVVELNTVDEMGNREYLHQIMQYVKNNFAKAINEVHCLLVLYCRMGKRGDIKKHFHKKSL